MKDPDEMRRKTAEAFGKIKDIFAEQGLLMVNLLKEKDEYQCDCCGKMFPENELVLIRAGALGNSAGCDTVACPECRGIVDEEE